MQCAAADTYNTDLQDNSTLWQESGGRGRGWSEGSDTVARQWYNWTQEEGEDNLPIDIRPLNVKIPKELKPDALAISTQSSGSNETADPAEPELRCNARVMLFDGDAFTIKSPGYPNPAQENEKYDRRANFELL